MYIFFLLLKKFIYLFVNVSRFLFSEQYIFYIRLCVYGASGKEKGSEGKSKRVGALKIKREGKFDTGIGASRVSRNEGNFTLRKEG